MKTFSASAAIAAPAERIWALLTDGPEYPSWNTTVDKVEGRIALGERIKVYAKVSPGRAFPVKVAVFEPGRRMVWQGGMPLGMFKGVRTFELKGPAGGPITFSMEEVYSGWMSSAIERSLPNLQPAFEEFAQALKRKAEAR